MILNEWLVFYSSFWIFTQVLHSQRCLVVTWLVPRQTAAVSARSAYTIQPCVCVCVSDFLIPLQTSAKYLVPILMKRCPWRNRWPLSATTFTSAKYPPSDHTSHAGTDLLVSSLILSRLDCCNFTLSDLPSSSLNRLQKVQNNAARRPPQTKIWLRYYPSGEKQNKQKHGSLLRPVSTTKSPHIFV